MSTATELLRLVVHEITAYGQVTYKTLEQIENFLAAEPEADEPVAWMHPNGGVIQTRLTGQERDTYTIPLYTRPEQSRKPMTREEIIAGVTHDTSDDFHAGYWAGIRWAERHHGIGGDDT